MKISLKEKITKDGRKSLYLEFYKGSYTDVNGKRKHLREFEYLKLYIYIEPKSIQEKRENKEVLQLAENILALRKTEFVQGKFDLQNTSKSKYSFLAYFSQLAEEKNKIDTVKNYDNWMATLKHLKLCISPTLTFNDIDENFLKKVRKYFDSEAKTKSNLLLSQNSKYSYFNKFKAALRAAFDEGYLTINYAQKAKSFDQAESQREYLTFEELKALTNAQCKYEHLKRAFLFSCLTGIRWSDINLLTWAEIRDEENGCRINFRQKKTDGVEYLYISNQARKLLGERRNESERIFVGLKYSMTFNTEITRWCMRAGITKHITFHSARHTNAVLLLENGADIYTVSKMLGHREIRTTSIYAKIVDSKMKEAANLIPSISLTNLL